MHDKSLRYLRDIANAFDPVEGVVHFDAAAWMRIRNAIYDLSAPVQAHSKTEFKRLKEQGADVLPPSHVAPPSVEMCAVTVERVGQDYDLKREAVIFAKHVRELAQSDGRIVYQCPRCATGMEVDWSAKPSAPSTAAAPEAWGAVRDALHSLMEFLSERKERHDGLPLYDALLKALDGLPRSAPSSIAAIEIQREWADSSDFDKGYVKGWNACRDEALKAAPSAMARIGGFTMVGLNTIRFEREEDATTVMNAILRTTDGSAASGMAMLMANDGTRAQAMPRWEKNPGAADFLDRLDEGGAILEWFGNRPTIHVKHEGEMLSYRAPRLPDHA